MIYRLFAPHADRARVSARRLFSLLHLPVSGSRSRLRRAVLACLINFQLRVGARARRGTVSERRDRQRWLRRRHLFKTFYDLSMLSSAPMQVNLS